MEMSLSLERTKLFESFLREGYRDSSVLPEIITTKWYDEETDIDAKFEQFVVRLPTERSWFTDLSVTADLVFSEIGRSISLHEERTIISLILAATHDSLMKQDETLFDTIFTAVDTLRSRGFRPQVLYVPIANYTRFFEWALHRKMGFDFGVKGDVLHLDAITSLLVRWSNNFMPLFDMILLDPAFGKWIVKPQGREKSRIDVFLQAGEELIAKTEFACRVVDKEAIVRWRSIVEESEARLTDFLRTFQNVEKQVGNILSKRGIAASTLDLSSLAFRLSSVDQRLGEAMESLLEVRNRIVHHPRSMNKDDILQAIEQANQLATNLADLREQDEGRPQSTSR